MSKNWTIVTEELNFHFHPFLTAHAFQVRPLSLFWPPTYFETVEFNFMWTVHFHPFLTTHTLLSAVQFHFRRTVHFHPFLTTHALLSTIQFHSLWTVHFRVLDRPLYVLSDRSLWPRTVHFWGFGPSIFPQDRPLSPRPGKVTFRGISGFLSKNKEIMH